MAEITKNIQTTPYDAVHMYTTCIQTGISRQVTTYGADTFRRPFAAHTSIISLLCVDTGAQRLLRKRPASNHCSMKYDPDTHKVTCRAPIRANDMATGRALSTDRRTREPKSCVLLASAPLASRLSPAPLPCNTVRESARRSHEIGRRGGARHNWVAGEGG